MAVCTLGPGAAQDVWLSSKPRCTDVFWKRLGLSPTFCRTKATRAQTTFSCMCLCMCRHLTEEEATPPWLSSMFVVGLLFFVCFFYLTWSPGGNLKIVHFSKVRLEKDKRTLGTRERRRSVRNTRSVRRRPRPFEKVFLCSIGISRVTRGRLLMPPQSSSWQWCWCTKTFPFPQQNIFVLLSVNVQTWWRRGGWSGVEGKFVAFRCTEWTRGAATVLFLFWDTDPPAHPHTSTLHLPSESGR